MYLVKGYYYKDNKKYTQTIIVTADSETAAINALLSTTIGLYIYKTELKKIDRELFILEQLEETVKQEKKEPETFKVRVSSRFNNGIGSNKSAVKILTEVLGISVFYAASLVVQEQEFTVTQEQFSLIREKLIADKQQYYSIRPIELEN